MEFIEAPVLENIALSNKEIRKINYKRLKTSSNLANLFTHHSVKNCLKKMTGNFVEVKYNPENQRSYFNGLMTCGSVWDCPVCSTKISLRRREEIKEGLKNWTMEGGLAVMVTFTIRHNKGDNLEDIVKVFNEAMRYVKSGSPYQKLKKFLGIAGTITATEVNYNLDNGWHYHKHQVLFIKNINNYDKDILENWFFNRYNQYLLENGYDCLEGIGVKITESNKENLSNYITKWGIPEELTSLNKQGKDSFTPFELLDYEEYHMKFIEYSKAMYGKQRLVWSNGLRKLLGLGEVLEDEEILETPETPEDVTIYRIDRLVWNYVIAHDLQVKILEIGDLGNGELIGEFINSHIITIDR